MKQQDLIKEANALNVFSTFHLQNRMKPLRKGKNIRSKIKGAKDAALLENFATPEEIKAAVKQALIWLEVLCDYVHQEGAELDWAWKEFATMLLIGIIFFITVAGKHDIIHCSTP